MPLIRIMNWNVEQLSWNKVQIPGMVDAIARTVYGSNVDILIFLELKMLYVGNILANLVAALNSLAGTNAYYSLRSYPTGGEYYGFIVRNLSKIRPLRFGPNPNALTPSDLGTEDHPFSDLRELIWTTWPTAFPNAVPAPPLPAAPRIGLTDVFASRALPREGKASRVTFAGRNLASTGYSLGRGFRLPCLALFGVAGTSGTYLIPILCCHYAAVRSGRNPLAQRQVEQLAYAHIAQLFSTTDLAASSPPQATSGYLATDLPGPAPGFGYLISNLVYTGDFNLNFLENQILGPNISMMNHIFLQCLTPTVQQGGSAGPLANPGVPTTPVPKVPFTSFPPAPIAQYIPTQALRAACTTQGTMLKPYDPVLSPPNTLAIRGAAFDNFFYGGAQLNSATVGQGGDSGQIIDVAANVVPASTVNPVPPQITLAGARNYYAKGLNTKNSWQAPRLSRLGAGIVLHVDDQWIGARFVSDHLPVVLEFNCP